MKRLVAVLGVLAFLSAPAAAELCKACRGKAYTMDVGKCVECGGWTSSSAFKLCKKCSEKLGQCEHCRAALKSETAKDAKSAKAEPPKLKTEEKPAQEPAADTKVDTGKSGVYASGKWRYEYAIMLKGSRSERRRGNLTYDAKPITGAAELDRINTPWGVMQYFGEENRWNSGWLLKTTYDGAIDEKKGGMLPDPESQWIAGYKKELQWRVGRKQFSLQLNYYGEEDKPFHRLMLAQEARPADGPPLPPFTLYQIIDDKQALKIIDHLEESGYLGQAEYWGRYQRNWVPPKGPCYVLAVPDFYGNLGWGLPMLRRLDALRGVLEGDAAKQMDVLLGRLGGLRKEWTGTEYRRPNGITKPE